VRELERWIDGVGDGGGGGGVSSGSIGYVLGLMTKEGNRKFVKLVHTS